MVAIAFPPEQQLSPLRCDIYIFLFDGKPAGNAPARTRCRSGLEAGLSRLPPGCRMGRLVLREYATELPINYQKQEGTESIYTRKISAPYTEPRRRRRRIPVAADCIFKGSRNAY
jgi:hypothetical protein